MHEVGVDKDVDARARGVCTRDVKRRKQTTRCSSMKSASSFADVLGLVAEPGHWGGADAGAAAARATPLDFA